MPTSPAARERQDVRSHKNRFQKHVGDTRYGGRALGQKTKKPLNFKGFFLLRRHEAWRVFSARQNL